MRIAIRTKLTLVLLLLLAIALAPVAFKGMAFFREDKEKSLQLQNAQTVSIQAREVGRRLRSIQRWLAVLAVTEENQTLRSLFDLNFQHHAWAGIFRLEGGALRSDRIVTPKVKGAGDSPEKVIQDSSLVTEIAKIPVGSLRIYPHWKGGEEPEVLIAARMAENLVGLTLGPPEILLDLRSDMKAYAALIIDKDGRIILYSESTKLSPDVSFKDHPLVPILNTSAPEIQGGMSKYVNPIDQEKMMGAYAPLGIADAGLILQISEREAFRAARDLMKRFGFLVFVIFIIAMIVSMGFASTLTKPIRRLGQMAAQVAKGDFKVKVADVSNDELGDLTAAFNKMGTELEERDQRLEQARNQLIQSEKMSAFGQMSAGIAHEVKNPLAGILGYAQLAKKKASPESGLDKYLEIIEKETKRCKDIVENLMRFARQEKTEFVECNVNQVVGDAMALVDHQITITGIKLQKSLAPDEGLPKISGNSNQLQQILTNLLLNAQQAMKDSGTITVSTRQGSNGWVEILVADTGEGIPKENLQKIFEPFFTTKPAGKGTGLGLAVTYGIVKDHKGEIDVQSEIGKGTTFIIRLPTGKEAHA